jgi:D-3-phosphoglycerate dehydrogenase
MKVLTTTSSFGKMSRRPLEMLEAAGMSVMVNPYGRTLTPEESIHLLADVDGLIAGTEKLNREVLNQAHRLKVISRVGTGMDSIDLTAAEERGIQVCNTPDAHVDGVAELTLAGMLNLLRQVAVSDRRVRQQTWKKPMGQLLRGKTVGVIGLGRTGKRLVELLRPFDTPILAYDPLQDRTFATLHQVHYLPLDEVLATADIITLHLNFSPENHYLLNQERLARLKPGAFVVNCARGGLVDEAALLAALQAGQLAGAYLDTFEREPYQGPLAELDNVLLTPHIGSYAAECRIRMEVEAVENLLRCLGV